MSGHTPRTLAELMRFASRWHSGPVEDDHNDSTWRRGMKGSMQAVNFKIKMRDGREFLITVEDITTEEVRQREET
jgi:hypothetical protein